MGDSYLLSMVSTVVVCLLVALANLLLASRAISSGAARALGIGFAFTGATWLLAALLPQVGLRPDISGLLLNSLGAVGMTALWSGFWLRGGFQVSTPFAAALLALWLLPVAAVVLFGLTPDLQLPFAAASISLGVLSSVWTLFCKRGSPRNAGDWALIAWLLLVLPLSAGVLAMNDTRDHPEALWLFYPGLLPTIFAGIGLFTLLGFTLDAVRDSAELALTDGLTGLLNRRAFDRELTVACARAERFQRDLTLIVLDIDFFKQLNDSYGHPAGDAVLRTVARVMEDQSRRIDVAARIGGEEFAMVLPDTPPSAALRIAERLRQGVAQSGNDSIAYTASFGVASAQEGGVAPKTLMQSAEDALHAAKDAGRNAVRYAGHENTAPAALIGAVK
jgi:diguanylate cyclase (GGDEF)-like protein